MEFSGVSIVTIDFEASCLPRHGRSYPIEVGIARDGRTWSWIIRPDDAWHDWDWTAQAQALHGLTRDQLMAQGLPARLVMDELNGLVTGHRVIADSQIDQYWLDTLAQAAGVPAAFHIDHVTHLFDDWQMSETQVMAAVAHADALGITRHRAGGDAAWLAALVAALRAGRAGQGAGELMVMR